jgi:hypothetical protein
MDTLATSAASHPGPAQSSRFPRWLLAVGVILLFGSGVLAARLIWEQTALTWERGPQNIGYSFIHGSGAILVFFPLVLVVWLAASVTYTLWRLLRRRPLSRSSVIVMVLSIGLLGVLWLPYGFWQRSFIDRLISGPHAGKFFVYDAAVGDLATVKAFLAHGIPVDIQVDGKTALHGAAVEGQLEVIKYLIAAGADVNATDRLGTSPLDVAISENHKEAAAYLSDHGAKMARGADEKPPAQRR